MDFIPLLRRGFKASRLKLIAPREQFQDDREPPLRLGDVVRLNSGGPACLVVDLPYPKAAILSWDDKNGENHECALPCDCVHRVRLAD